MRRFIVIILSIIAIFGFICCGDGGEEETNDNQTKISAEMKDFMSMMDGTTVAVSNAVNKYAEDGVDKDITSYELAEPKVKEVKEVDDSTCYVLSVKSGVTRRKYDICWKEGKIVSIEFTGFDQ
jgi:hypothetical protein